MTALGYVHAQDRLWQMELMRRIAPGRFVWNLRKVALKNDTFCRPWYWRGSERAIADLDKNSESYKLTMGYLDGINQYMEEGLHRVSVGRCAERKIHHKRCL
jgi:penicillin amidase